MGEWTSAKGRPPKDGVDVLCWYEYFRYGSYNRMFQTYGPHCGAKMDEEDENNGTHQ